MSGGLKSAPDVPLPIASRKPLRHAAETGRLVPLAWRVADLALAHPVARHGMPVELMRSRTVKTVATEGHAMHHEAASMQAADAVEADLVKADAAKADAAKADAAKADAVEAESVEACGVEACAVKTSTVKATTTSGRGFGLSHQSTNQDRNRCDGSGDGSLAHHLFAQSIERRRSDRLCNYTS
jgi:hypothetical protein